MFSAVSNRGGLAFQIFSGGFVVAIFIGFLERLLKDAKGRSKAMLIVDGHPVHRAKRVKAWLAGQRTVIEMHLLPGCAPELNPDELLNHDVKIAMGKPRPRSREDLRAKLRTHLQRRQKQPAVVRNFSQANRFA